MLREKLAEAPREHAVNLSMRFFEGYDACVGVTYPIVDTVFFSIYDNVCIN